MPEGLLVRMHPLTLTAAFLVLVGMALEAGYRVGSAERRAEPKAAATGIGPIEGTVYALLGLLLAFTFSFTVARSDGRRQLLIEETNAIGTSYLRCALAPEPERETLQRLMRDYLDVRIEYSVAGFEPDRIVQVVARGGELQAEIWRIAADLMRREPHNEGYALLLDSLNTTFDVQTSRLAALRRRLPDAVILMLFATAALTSAVAGYAVGLKGDRHVLAWPVFVTLLGIVMYVIIDLDRPRRGLFRTPPGPLLELRQSLEVDAR